jgi:hypothetical protein
MSETITFGAESDVDGTAPDTWLAAAWHLEAEVSRLKKELKRAEAARETALRNAVAEGATDVDLGYGIVRLTVRPGVEKRVLDVDLLKTHYPAAFKKIAKYTVTLADADRVLGKERVMDLCTTTTGEDRYTMKLEPAVVPIAREVSGP